MRCSIQLNRDGAKPVQPEPQTATTATFETLPVLNHQSNLASQLFMVRYCWERVGVTVRRAHFSRLKCEIYIKPKLCIPLSWQAARSWDRKFTQPRPQMSQEPCLKFVALPCAMHCMLGLGNVLGRWLCAPSGFPDWRGQGVSWDRGIETANPSLFWIQELMETLRSCEAQSMTCMMHRTSSNRSWSIRVLHLEAYDLTTDQWRTAPSLNVARAGARLVMKEESKKARTQHEI